MVQRNDFKFFADYALDAAVVGVSGGVDSALVLAILRTKNREQLVATTSTGSGHTLQMTRFFRPD